jgi:hypothetical protein
MTALSSPLQSATTLVSEPHIVPRKIVAQLAYVLVCATIMGFGLYLMGA